MPFSRRVADAARVTASVASPALRRIVVVVPAHDERERLPDCLNSLAVAANRVTVPVQVAVVLDDCTDGTAEIVPAAVSALTISARNVGAARGAGFRAFARGTGAETWLATTDADSVVPPTWLTNHVDHFHMGAEAVVGTVSVQWREHSRVTQHRYDTRYRMVGAAGVGHGHVHGANFGVRADKYWQIGGFGPLRLGEDVDLAQRLVRSDVQIAWDTDHPVRTSDRRQSRAPGGFGDYVRGIAEDQVAL